MIAQVLVELGVFMGDSLDRAVFEDIEIARTLENNKEDLVSLIEKRNENYEVWGFKRPTAYKQLKSNLNKFRNPKIIVAFRDPVAIANRNTISIFSDFSNALLQAGQEMNELIKFVSKLKVPTFFVSYEKAMVNKNFFVSELVNFCGLSLEKYEVAEIVKLMVNGPDKYLNESRVKLEGRIDTIKNNIVRGWARQIGVKKPLAIRISAGDRVLGRGMADMFRNDLKKAKKSDGHCAFEVKIPEIPPGTVLTVIVDPYDQIVAEKTLQNIQSNLDVKTV